jgi:carbon storage regulator CsrA
MLVLSRKLNEKILLPGTHTAIQVIGIKPGVVRLGIDAPPEVIVLREEIPDRSSEWLPRATPAAPAQEEKLKAVGHLAVNRLKMARAELAILRHQLQSGLLHEAETTLDKLDDDIRALRQRVRSETDAAAPIPLPRKTR